jgi:topoisomerase-4 subunit A
MAEVVFAKVKGVQKETLTVDLEQFIAVKGIKAIGNQLTTDKLKQVNLLDPLPYEEPESEEDEVVEVLESASATEDIQTELDEDGQITLSLD